MPDLQLVGVTFLIHMNLAEILYTTLIIIHSYSSYNSVKPTDASVQAEQKRQTDLNVRP